ncbi:M48 family metallopeptidase [Thermomonas sp. XSG]|jgi:predicted Zn-dependent protease|uniref:M48 family metallopeptidase n=1 Tax=Thermomonas sp. XSG TaxID=2771436 RepID=UPI00086E5688|nr:M48 family metallopeptidase [Thermomonas sp. XSG]ODU49399.1 MAG: peptidase [Xanthomonadaceae bacterium SCN 69-48]QNU16220.1 M48 family metallopeptidase [Thermomonas sp. XSG]
MNRNPIGTRRGGGLRIWVLVLFAGYAAWYWYSNRSVDALTGETVVIDKNISPEQETALGLQAYQEVLQQERPLPADAQVSRQVGAIAQRLIAKIPPVSDALAAENGMQASHIEKSFDWKVTVLESDQVNAFCLPGGKMAVYTGLLPVAQNADAVAVVMGHEIAHALLRHGAQRMTRGKLEQIGQMAGAASGMDQNTMQAVMQAYGYGSALPYARSQETQADELGLMLAAAACFDPRESVPLWERMDRNSGGGAPPEFASTHPSAGTRIQQLQALMPKALAYQAKFCETAASAAR